MSKQSLDGQQITSERVEPCYFAMIPKMAIIDLGPYELALYCNYKQTASDSEGGQCYKANKTLATETGMSVSKLKKARESLMAKGYITVTENRDPETGIINQPPIVKVVDIWAVNRKRFAQGGGSVVTGGGREKTTPLGFLRPGVGVRKHQRITLKEKPTQEKPEEEDSSAAVAKVSQVYEQNIGTLTPMIADSIKDWCQDMPSDWIVEAVQIAVEQNKRSWAYITKILGRWHREGKDNGRGKAKPKPAPTPPPSSSVATMEPLTPEEAEKRKQDIAVLKKSLEGHIG
ncbi:MAG: DnaD domain protein [Anaerolineae bacterium]|nr:DnaD domain protein [Anaerolineae bacterium]